MARLPSREPPVILPLGDAWLILLFVQKLVTGFFTLTPVHYAHFSVSINQDACLKVIVTFVFIREDRCSALLRHFCVFVFVWTFLPRLRTSGDECSSEDESIESGLQDYRNIELHFAQRRGHFLLLPGPIIRRIFELVMGAPTERVYDHISSTPTSNPTSIDRESCHHKG